MRGPGAVGSEAFGIGKMFGVARGQSPAGAWGMKPEGLCPRATPTGLMVGLHRVVGKRSPRALPSRDAGQK